MLDRPQRHEPLRRPPAGHDAMTGDGDAEQQRARRFRDAALPYLDDVAAFTRYLMRNAADGNDAAQECYLRALRHFDSYRGPAIKPWLLAIARNVCHAEMSRRAKQRTDTLDPQDDAADVAPLWQEPPASPENIVMRAHDGATIRRLVSDLPQPFREVIVLREVNELSYEQIAKVAGIPLGTVMSRLARARSMLRAAWNDAEGPAA
jgi:RNA polymerase sigma-70 factor (ECF subfamily)